MSMCVLGMSAEFKKDGIAFNALWPRTAVSTAALNKIQFASELGTRHPLIMADAALEIVTKPSRECTGNFFIDEKIFLSKGMTIEQINKKYNLGDKVTHLPDDFFLGKAQVNFAELNKRQHASKL
eukprot:c17399_g1_i1.p1 GENE.c17399_g1_i1~~c17399_g1_i1.p1  ORF type:complete len:125 (+),score=36.37 c17399_g1_i1:91-465(+)